MSELNLAEYREFVRGCIHPGVNKVDDLPMYARAGYNSEIGEMYGEISKSLRESRHADPMPERRWQNFVQECGDVLHYLMMIQIADGDFFEPNCLSVRRDLPLFRLVKSVGYIGITEMNQVLLPDMTIEQLAYVNQQKLLARREELGVFAKP